MKKFYCCFYLFLFSATHAQQTFTHRDSLRGSMRPERRCYNVLRYDLNIKIDPEKKSIVGYNDISFQTTQSTDRLQVDLFANMQIDSITMNNQKLLYSRDFDAVFITIPPLDKGSKQSLRFYYSGNPTVAINAPWDGGFVFSTDSSGKPWIGVAVQGTGASLWFPCKDSQTDEPDNGATIKVAVPTGLMNVSNGQFMGSEVLKDGFTRWNWEVKNPINNYDITVNIADYVHFSEVYKGLNLDYYVLRENQAKAKLQFEEVKPMMDCFQLKFGAYPFLEDGYKLVETPYLGMEHQSAVAYGNNYQKGYKGTDWSGTGIGLLFDFIIIHESGHEWFGNSITAADIADMWIHEAFTCYSESVYLECVYGKEKALDYVNGLKRNVANDRSIIGHYGVNNEGSGDMYWKGALMLNTIRSVINDDAKWWQLILDYATHFKHQIITTEQVVDYFNARSKLNLTPIFNQYLRFKEIPILQVRKHRRHLQYRWKTDEPNFAMPVEVNTGNEIIRLDATNDWNSAKIKIKNTSPVSIVDSRFYVQIERL